MKSKRTIRDIICVFAVVLATYLAFTGLHTAAQYCDFSGTRISCCRSFYEQTPKIAYEPIPDRYYNDHNNYNMLVSESEKAWTKVNVFGGKPVWDRIE